MPKTVLRSNSRYSWCSKKLSMQSAFYWNGWIPSFIDVRVNYQTICNWCDFLIWCDSHLLIVLIQWHIHAFHSAKSFAITPHSVVNSTSIEPIHKCHNALAPCPTMHHSEQKCTHFCSEWCIMGYETGELRNLWSWFTVLWGWSWLMW